MGQNIVCFVSVFLINWHVTNFLDILWTSGFKAEVQTSFLTLNA